MTYVQRKSVGRLCRQVDEAAGRHKCTIVQIMTAKKLTYYQYRDVLALSDYCCRIMNRVTLCIAVGAAASPAGGCHNKNAHSTFTHISGRAYHSNG
jgi:hypothetical protein